jgi:hypothetical protein
MPTGILVYIRLVVCSAWSHSASLARNIIFYVLVIAGTAILLVPIIGMTIDASGLRALLSNAEFYAILFGSIVLSRLLCAPYWVWKEEREARVKAEKQIASPIAATILPPPQERLLILLADCQRRFAAYKLIIGRRDGKLYFDGDPKRDEGINLIQDLFGHVDQINATRFEESICSERNRGWFEVFKNFRAGIHKKELKEITHVCANDPDKHGRIRQASA